MKTIIVWYRNDLRIHDHPALSAAVAEADYVVPVFIFSQQLLEGKNGGSNRNRFLIESLQDLSSSLKGIGTDLLIRHGTPEEELKKLQQESGAEGIFYAEDYSPYARTRDAKVAQALEQKVELRSFPGRLIIERIGDIQTKTGTDYKVFTPFWRAWSSVERRPVAEISKNTLLPKGLTLGTLPSISTLTKVGDLSQNVIRGGETAARQRLTDFLEEDIHSYHENNNAIAKDSTSRLSAYIHFGCVSPREIETMLPAGTGPEAWHRQLCWRDFYHYILLKYPKNVTTEFQERYRKLEWGNDTELLRAWETGTTGYPVVDAAMRQLREEGWMHNRSRLIVGSFLTKDLWLDWRLGERYFMKMLVDGDEANNNGNWQWIASVGVDPAPLFRRLYNPVSQHKVYDPDSTYVRRYVPELRGVPDTYIYEPWNMPEDVQQASGCTIDEDYPAPIVNHAQARLIAIERYADS